MTALAGTDVIRAPARPHAPTPAYRYAPTGTEAGGSRTAPLRTSQPATRLWPAAETLLRRRLLLSTYFGGSEYDSIVDLSYDRQGGLYVVGTTYSPDLPTRNPLSAFAGLTDIFVAKVDPGSSSLLYSTYLGGSYFDDAAALAVDDEGQLYIVATTSSPDMPTANPVQTAHAGGQDVYAAVLDSTGQSLVFASYLGGSGSDVATALSIGVDGSIFIAGFTDSSDFPLQRPFQPRPGGESGCGFDASCRDAFIAEITPDRELAFATYFGGKDEDVGETITVALDGSVTVAGFTRSRDLPTTSDAIQRTLHAGTCRTSEHGQTVDRPCKDGFVSTFSSPRRDLSFSTYFGGAQDDEITALVGGPACGLSLSGYSRSDDLPVTRDAIQRSLRTGECVDLGERVPCADVFMLDVSCSPVTLSYATYYGGAGDEFPEAIAPGRAGEVIVAGTTTSVDFPSTDGSRALGLSDVFLADFDDRRSIVLAAVIGGRSYDRANGVAVTAEGVIAIGGVTTSDDWPLINAIQSVRRSGDGLIAVVDTLGASTRICLPAVYVDASPHR